MNKQTVGYSESVEMFNPMTGLKKWVKVWNEKEINADEDRNVAFNDVQSFVQNKFHKDNNPQLTDGGLVPFEEVPINKPVPSIDRKAIDVKEKIEDAKIEEELQLLWDNAVKYNLQEQYGNQLEKILNHTPY